MEQEHTFKERTITALSDVRYKILPVLERPLDKNSLVGAGTFFQTAQFPWALMLEKKWQLIRQELDGVLQSGNNIPTFQEVLPSQQRLTNDNDWKTFMFLGYGHKMQANCDRCPETTRLLEQIPGMKTAFFSILSPGKHIPAHRGFYKGVLRYHLGLIVPKPKERCRIRVGNDIRHWEEGKSLIFDDTFDHEVWNDTDGVRVVLFLDVIRPLPFPWSSWNNLMIKLISWTPEIQRASKNQDKWA